MKQPIISVCLLLPALLGSSLAMANTSPSTAKQTAASAAASKKAEQKPKAIKKTARPTSASRKAAALAGAASVTAAAATTTLAPRTLSSAELALADRVYTGRIACKSNAYVNVIADTNHAGHFFVSGKGFRFHMSPVATTTGVVRLEDRRAGAVWLQIANKSMLMNQKLGKRLADDCMNSQQQLVAEAIKKNPPRNLLEPRK